MNEQVVVNGKKKSNVFALVLFSLGVIVVFWTLPYMKNLWRENETLYHSMDMFSSWHSVSAWETYSNFITYYFGEMFSIKHYFNFYAKLALIGYLLTIVAGVLLLKTQKSRIVVCEDCIVGNLGYGKPVEIPMAQVKELKPCKFSGITILTTSGEQKFYTIKNRDEVMRAIAELIEDKTANDVSTTNRDHVEQDELIKLKELFEQGVITQEEFSAKKKQILGL